MSYDIYIGNAEIEYDSGMDEDDWPHIRVTVNEVELDAAPVFENDSMTGNSNNRHPSYSAWNDFIQRTKLEGVFWGDDGLMSEHPGIKPLNETHYQAIHAALVAYRASLPEDVKPGFLDNYKYNTEGKIAGIMTDGDFAAYRESMKLDAHLARLIWLEWWVRWALDNCQYPAIYNS